MPHQPVDPDTRAPVLIEDSAESAALATLYRKVTGRLLPLLFACYVISYLDRVNVGFAKLQMDAALGFGDAVFGLGAGIFFVGFRRLLALSRTLALHYPIKKWAAALAILGKFTAEHRAHVGCETRAVNERLRDLVIADGERQLQFRQDVLLNRAAAE